MLERIPFRWIFFFLRPRESDAKAGAYTRDRLLGQLIHAKQRPWRCAAPALV
jgi:hypothetical protein